jgi:hypothetical protein
MAKWNSPAIFPGRRKMDAGVLSLSSGDAERAWGALPALPEKDQILYEDLRLHRGSPS